MTFRYEWQFPVDHPALAGHFPGQPIAPGAVLLDRLLLFARQVPALAESDLALEQAKFLQVCHPGDRLLFVFERRESGSWRFRIERESRVLVQGILAACGTAAA